MTDDVAGQYSDWQDRQDRLNRTPEEILEDELASWLSKMVSVLADEDIDDDSKHWHGYFKRRAQSLIKHLDERGYEIKIKEVNK